MQVQVSFVDETREQKVTVINSFYSTMYNTVDLVTVRKPQATVDGILWTTRQTQQAIADAGVCKCRNCVCCLIAKAAWGRR